MNITKILKQAEKLVADNSPAILTGIGVAGLITTAYLSGQASYKANEIIVDESVAQAIKLRGEGDNPQTLTKREKFDLVWKLYIPAATVGTLSCIAIIGANRIGNRRAAAVAAAYSVSERAYQEYKDKVVEKMGENKEREIRDEIAQDRINRQDAPKTLIITDTGGQVMCHDAFSNQYFLSDMQTIRKAQNDINAQILHADYATVNDFYDSINEGRENTGLEHTSVSGDMGWNTDRILDINFSTVMYKETTPCISIDFATVPVRNPWRYN